MTVCVLFACGFWREKGEMRNPRHALGTFGFALIDSNFS